MISEHELKFQRVRREVSAELKRLGELLPAGDDKWAPFRARVEMIGNPEGPLKLAIAGPYTAGKSTLIHALTGAALEVGMAPMTAEVKRYQYGDVDLIDMPGTLAGQLEHDKIAKTAVAECDLLIFVVSNELFSEESLPYFKLAAEELAKKDQILLVVNKFDRFNLAGRTPEEAVAFIISTLQEELDPLDVQRFSPVVVSAKNFLSSLQQDDAEKRTRKAAKSRFSTLVQAIDDFTTAKGVIAREVSPIQQALEVIVDAKEKALEAEPDRVDLDRFLRRRRFVLVEARAYARTEFIRVREDARAKILHPVERVLRALEEGVDEAEIERLWAEVENEIKNAVDQLAGDMEDLVDRLRADLEARLDEVNASPLAEKILKDLHIDLGDLNSEGIAVESSERIRHMAIQGVGKAAEQLTKSSKQVAEVLAKIYKFFGGKFKPWGKVKLGKFLGKAGKVLGPLAVAAETYLEYRADTKKEEAERALRSFRTEVRAQFADAANQLSDQVDIQAAEISDLFYGQLLRDLDEQAQALHDEVDSKSRLAEELNAAERRYRHLVDREVSSAR